MCLPDFAYRTGWRSRPEIWQQWARRPVLVIVLQSWELNTQTQRPPWSELVTRHRDEHPSHRIVFAANEERDAQTYAKNGIEGIWCSPNVLIDENIFRPAENTENDHKDFDGIYDARLSRFKRHRLALKVTRLALIRYARLSHLELCWWLGMRYQLRRAAWLNPTNGLGWPRDLEAREVAAALRRARVGLCLSYTEGAMLASAQYLLTGLPIVSTPSAGGRDQFFDDYNSLIVDSTNDAVADGVRTMMAREPDPHLIRANILSKMAPHRHRLMALVADFQRQHGVRAEDQRWTVWKSLENPFRAVLFE